MTKCQTRNSVANSHEHGPVCPVRDWTRFHASESPQSQAVRSGPGPGSRKKLALASTACNTWFPLRRWTKGCDCRPWHTRNRTAVGSRGGYTLVELLVVVAITSMILTSVGVTLTTLFRFEGQLRSGAAEQAILGRLTLQLRGDAHQATAVDPLPGEEAEQGFVLHLPDDSFAEYRTTPRGVRRTVRRGDQRIHHELFRLSSGGQFGCEIRREGDMAAVTLRINHPLPTESGRMSAAGHAAQAVRIEAVVGLNRFLARGGG